MDKIAYAKRFADSLHVATGERDLYCCPLCLGRIPLSEAPTLTADHYPPQVIGGREGDAVLICEHCRRKWFKVDDELVRLTHRERFNAEIAGAEPVVVGFPETDSVKGLRHRESLSVKNGQIQLVGREADGSQATERLTQFLDELSSTGGWDKLVINFRTDPAFAYSPLLVERSFLKAAYLAAFDHLGYPYIFSEALGMIRQQIMHPEMDLVVRHTFTISHQPASIERKIVFAYVREPQPLTGLLVMFLNYRLSRGAMVLLPTPSHPGFPQYGRLAEAAKEAGQMAITIFEPGPDTIMDTDPVLTDGTGREWHIYKIQGQMPPSNEAEIPTIR